jgi:hypothetical protein
MKKIAFFTFVYHRQVRRIAYICMYLTPVIVLALTGLSSGHVWAIGILHVVTGVLFACFDIWHENKTEDTGPGSIYSDDEGPGFFTGFGDLLFSCILIVGYAIAGPTLSVWLDYTNHKKPTSSISVSEPSDD